MPETKESLAFGFWLKVILEKSVKAAYLVGALRKGRSTKKNFDYTEMENSIILVQFRNEIDARTVEDNEPWCFYGSLVAMSRWEPYMAHSKISFDTMSVWIKLKRLPFEWVSKLVLTKIGSKVGGILSVELGFQKRNGNPFS